jgi:hypothetical protein
MFCLLDYTDFPAGTAITVPTTNDYQVGDPVTFAVEGGATLDTALTAGTTYYIVVSTSSTIQVSTSSGGSAVTLNGDGGTGSADTPGTANHISIDYAEYAAVCQVREFSIDITREELDVTTLPCGIGSTVAAKFAPFRSTQSGYASGSGSMSVYFTDDQTSLANRLLGNVLLRSQQGASVKLYVNTVSNNAGTAVDDAESLYIESDITMSSMNLSVNPDDPTTAEINFNIINPKNILGKSLV